ncbi:MAG: DegV family protein, partial [Peptococcaceae bacterium]|nr:DegV family protein [Peptococcaceae bacterium]
MIKIIVDSTCDLPQEILQEYDIKILPLNVLLNGVEYRDRVDIQVEEVYAQMKKGIVPKTSQVSPKEIHSMFTHHIKQATDFIYLAFSSALSGTHNLAKSIQEELTESNPNIKMAVVDSKGGSVATGLIVLQAARLARSGLDFANIIKQIDFMVKHVEHIFAISDLEWLIKGGRINRIVGKTGSILNIKPILDVQNGKMRVISAVRGQRKALRTVVDLVAERIKEFPDQIVGIAHADDLPAAEEVMEMLRTKIGASKFIVQKIGCVLGAHPGI